jgi:hypothetical protein
LSIPGEQVVAVRSREQARSNDLRKPEYLPPAEVRAAVLQVISRNLGIRSDDVPAPVAKLFGFRTTSPRLRETIVHQVDFLLESDQVVSKDSRLFTVESAEVT